MKVDIEFSENFRKTLDKLKQEEKDKESEFLYETFIKDWVVETPISINEKNHNGDVLNTYDFSDKNSFKNCYNNMPQDLHHDRFYEIAYFFVNNYQIAGFLSENMLFEYEFLQSEIKL